ncbi:MAG: TraR/DksA C4-type zinc finger protein [Candidatus Daviesbacteria bacterium]|nr:MAG: TraR/DksA C4-type zinc finger protein [Candidatus Daviesbacteria bacterium]
MLNLPRKTLIRIKNLLQRQQREVEENIEKVEKDDPTKDIALAESSEPGTESWIAEGHAKAIAIANELKNAAGNIKLALSKIRQGKYGVCEKCGKNIEHQRLLIIPTTRYCMACSKIKHKQSLPSGDGKQSLPSNNGKQNSSANNLNHR